MLQPKFATPFDNVDDEEKTREHKEAINGESGREEELTNHGSGDAVRREHHDGVGEADDRPRCQAAPKDDPQQTEGPDSVEASEGPALFDVDVHLEEPLGVMYDRQGLGQRDTTVTHSTNEVSQHPLHVLRDLK